MPGAPRRRRRRSSVSSPSSCCSTSCCQKATASISVGCVAARRDRPLVIILSARSSKDDKVRGLDLGADDYVTKPFAFAELLARMRAVMRRRDLSLDVLHMGDVVVDFRARRATRGGKDINLSQREIEVLQYWRKGLAGW